MKLLGALCIANLLLFLGIAAADARQEQQERQEKQEKGPKQEGQAKPEKRQEHAKGRQEQQQRDKSAKQEQQQQAKGQQDRQRQERQQQDKSARQEQQQQANRQQEQEQQHQQQANRSPQEAHHGGPRSEQRVVWQRDRARSWQSEHRTWQQRGGYSGYRVPEDRFRRSFGRDHGFRIYSLPVVVVGTNRRFQYGGYWFSLVDPWPEYWSDNWYDNDDLYLDYSDDGYYMYNRRHPGDRIAISLYVN